MCVMWQSHLIVVITWVDGCIVVEVTSNLGDEIKFSFFLFLTLSESENRFRKEVKIDFTSINIIHISSSELHTTQEEIFSCKYSILPICKEESERDKFSSNFTFEENYNNFLKTRSLPGICIKIENAFLEGCERVLVPCGVKKIVRYCLVITLNVHAFFSFHLTKIKFFFFCNMVKWVIVTQWRLWRELN